MVDNRALRELSIVVGDSRGRDAKTITPPIPIPIEDVGSLAWSPDGARLAFGLPEGVGEYWESHVFVVGRDGARLTRVTSVSGVREGNVSWSLAP